MGNHRDRDERGWRVPRDGTTSAKIYHMLVNNWRIKNIAEKLGIDGNKCGVLAWKIRHPEAANRKDREKRCD